MAILVTNDDGLHAPGIKALVRALSEAPDRTREIVVVAPEAEQSAVGHAITIADPLKVRELPPESPVRGFAVAGTPADCVKLAAWELLGREEIELVVSGINRGANTGLNLMYSGTVSAATEAAMVGLTGVALSLDSYDQRADYGPAAELAVRLIDRILEQSLEPGLVFNINFPARPDLALTDCVPARQGMARMRETYHRREDPRGNVYYWLDGEKIDIPNHIGPIPTDQQALARGQVPITPVRFDLTDHDWLARL